MEHQSKPDKTTYTINDLGDHQELNLDNQHLSTLPDQIRQLADLKVLSIYKNHLTGVPETIWQLTELEVLNLADNKFTVCQTI